MSFASLAAKPNTKKIVLCEIDIGRDQDFWTNWSAGIYYLDLDAVYDRIDASLLDGVDAIEMGGVGSVLKSSSPLLSVNSLADVFTHADSFFFDVTTNRVYIHLVDYDNPELYDMVMGESIRVSNFAGIYGGYHYEGRLAEAPNISKSRDPLFFSKISFDGGTVKIINADGKFDMYGENQDLFGCAARLRLGFDDLDYADFEKIYTGFVEHVSIDEDYFTVTIRDKRKQLSRKVPNNSFDTTTYPNLNERNDGKAIAIGYGPDKKAKAVCTNEKESTPANYAFKFLDTTHRSIYSIDQVYVDDAEVSHSNEDLDNAVFTLATTDYSPGQAVTVDYQGYKDSGGVLIDNGLDVILDLMTTYYPIVYDAYYFNLTEWAAARAVAPNIGIHISKPKEIWKIIEEISNSIQGYWPVQDDGLYSYRIYDPDRAAAQTIRHDELLKRAILSVDYLTDEVLTSCRVGYLKDNESDEYIEYPYTQQEAAIFKKYKLYRDKTFKTLLTTEAAALAYAVKIMSIAGDVMRPIPIKTSTQTVQRKIGDMINVEYKLENRDFIGTVKAEIIKKVINTNDFTVALMARIIEHI